MITVGDTLICIDVRQHPADLLAVPLRIGKEYKCLGIRQCACGAVFIDVGLSLRQEDYHIVCNCQRKQIDGIWWFAVERFQKKPNARQEVVLAGEVLKYCPN